MQGVMKVAWLVLMWCAATLACAHAQQPAFGAAYSEAAVRVQGISLLRDGTGTLRIDDVSSPSLAGAFTSAPGVGERVLGYTPDVIWLRFRLVNELQTPVITLVQMGVPRLRDVRFYIRASKGEWQFSRSGLDVPVSARQVHSRYPVFEVSLAPSEQRDVFVRVHSGNAIHVVARTWKPSKFSLYEQRVDFFNALQTGAEILLAIYGLILFFGTRDRNYLYFAFLLSSYAMYELSIYQYAHQYFWAEYPEWAMRSPGLFMGMACIANVLLLSRMLRTRETMPAIHFSLRTLAFAALVFSVLTVTTYYAHAVRPLNVISLLAISGSLLAVLLACFRCLPNARLLLIVFLLFWMVALLRVSVYMGLAPADWLMDYSQGWTVVLAGLLMTVSLIDKVLAVNQERMRVQHELLRGQVVARERLESQVQVRTAELQAAKERAESAAAAKSRFLAQLSHELRTPLHSVLGNAGLMLGEKRGDDDTRRLQAIQRSGRHLLALIEEVLEFVRGDSGRLALLVRDVWLRELLRGVIDEMTPEARSAEAQLLLQVDDDVPDGLQMDAVRLRQVLINLVANACRHSRGRVVSIQAHRVGEEEGRVLVRFEVHDDGEGVSDDEQAALFDPFWQSVSGGRAIGLGLGLPISRQWVRLMGGDIDYERRSSGGSVFRFTLPLAPARGEQAKPADATVPTEARLVSGTWRATPFAVPATEDGVGIGMVRPSPKALARLHLAAGLGLITDIAGWVQDMESAEPEAAVFVARIKAALARVDLAEIRRLAGE